MTTLQREVAVTGALELPRELFLRGLSPSSVTEGWVTSVKSIAPLEVNVLKCEMSQKEHMIPSSPDVLVSPSEVDSTQGGWW